jgi:microcystin-dependent protein
MADRRISQLNAADTLVENDLLVFADVSATETKRITGENLGLAMVQFGTTRGSDVPSSPANGQLWVDTSNNPPQLKIYNGATFSLVSEFEDYADITSPGTSQPSTPVEGQLWLDTTSSPATLKSYETASASFIPVVNAISQTAGDARYLQITTAASTYLSLSGGTLTGTLTLDAAPTANLQAATKKYVDDQVAAVDVSDPTPAGTVIYSARQTAPTGYLVCDGSVVSRTTYATLFSAIGTAFGAGDGSSTFALPDLRGQFVRGWNSGANDQSVTSDVDSGRSFGSGQTDQLQSHTHTVPYRAAGPSGAISSIGDNAGVADSTKSTNFGDVGRFGDETRPVNVALLACIKT